MTDGKAPGTQAGALCLTLTSPTPSSSPPRARGEIKARERRGRGINPNIRPLLSFLPTPGEEGRNKERKTIMKKYIATAALAAGMAALALPALAAQPNNQACLGEDFSGYAQGLRPFGQALNGLGLTDGGLGAEVQAHLAGLVPDGVIPNSCND